MSEPIGPTTTVISYLLSLTDVRDFVGEQVAAKHAYGQVDLPDETPRGWLPGSRAITLRLADSDGTPDTAKCGPDHRVRLEARCYGESGEDAERVWALLVGVCAAFTRQAVELPDGRRVLLSVLFPLDGPFAEYDPDIDIDYVRCTLRAHLSSTPL
jgi:hypothetical protein